MALSCSGKQLLGQTITVQGSQAEKNRAAQATKFKKLQMAEQEKVEVKHKNCKVCIQGLLEDSKMQQIGENEVRQYFKGCGLIEEIEIPRDHITLRPKGYILIQFSSPEEAKEAVNLLDGFEIDGKKIHVQIYTDSLQKQLNVLDGKKGVEQVDDNSGTAYIHSGQARQVLMHKLMEGKNIDPQAMGLRTGLDSDSLNNNLVSSSHQPSVGIGSSNCICISNMFDPNQVDLDKDPTFYIDIKTSVQQFVGSMGQVDTVYVEQNSAGNVWVRFGGPQSTMAASQA